jgi:hypothetical protein
MVYEKNSVRTVELNPAVELIFSNVKRSRGRKKRKHTDFGVLSHRVESEGEIIKTYIIDIQKYKFVNSS